MPSSASITLTPTAAPAIGTQSTPHTRRTTVHDMVEHCRDYLGSNVNPEANRVILRSIQAALRELTNIRRWTYYYKRGRIQTDAPYSTGTVAFLLSSGTYPRQLTLTSGTWPSWAQYGSVLIGDVVYDVQRRISNTVLQLDDTVTPVADIASTTYTLYRDTYTLPADFVSSDRGFVEINWGGMEYVPPSDWLRHTQYYRASSNTPRFYTFTGLKHVPGRLGFRVFPYPDSSRAVDFIYHRRPREVTLSEYTTGTATVDINAAPTTITGSGTAWTNSMVGSVIRLSSNATTLPTAFEGSNPSVVERNITVFSSATSITVDDTIDTSYTGVKYRISDPIDIEDGAMLEAFFRCCEKHLAITRQLKTKAEAVQLYRDALIKAEEADSRSFQGRVAGQGNWYYQRLADMPLSD